MAELMALISNSSMKYFQEHFALKYGFEQNEKYTSTKYVYISNLTLQLLPDYFNNVPTT